jgi:integrase
MAKALTAKGVENAKAKANKKTGAPERTEIPDGLLTGLYLIVQPTGAKSWAVRYRYGGKPRKVTLGPFPALDLGKAREEAKAALQAVAKGRDPASQKAVEKEEARSGRDLFENVVAEFLKRHRKRDGSALKSLPEIERMFNVNVIPRWRGRRIQDITRRDVNQLLDGLVDSGIGPMANRVFSVIRKLFNWAVARDIVSGSPCVGVTPPAPEPSRERVLTDDEIKRFWKATEETGYPFGPMFRLLLVTGQRLSEVAELPWRELDRKKRVWSLPSDRTKNGRAHDVPLSDIAIEIIEGLPKIASTRDLVFTTGERPASGFSRAKKILDARMAGDGAEILHFILHDLRRTVATRMQELGIPPHVTEAVLNHKSGAIKGVAAVYARHDYAAEKRAALDAWARRLLETAEGRKADNVVELRAGA